MFEERRGVDSIGDATFRFFLKLVLVVALVVLSAMETIDMSVAFAAAELAVSESKARSFL